MRAPGPAVPFIYIRLLCSLLADRGYDSGPWLRVAGIKPETVLNPEASITVGQVDRFLAELEMRTGRTDWGFYLGRALKLTSHGTLGFALVSGETLGDVGELCARYYRMINPLFIMVTAVEGGVAAFHFSRVMGMPERVRLFYEETTAVSVYEQILPFLRGRTVRQFEIRMSMPAPRHVAVYSELAGVRVSFSDRDTPGVSIYFDEACLHIPNPMADSGSKAIAEEICRRRCLELDQMHGWGVWVARALRSAEGDRPTQTDLAALLHMSPRTLERALAREGTSFKEIYERVGFERACEMLDEGRENISAISERLGYSSIGAFSRAFKRRSGITPSEYLERAGRSR